MSAADNHRFIPPELVEEILSKLPHKSLIRFSSVSKQWNSIIHGSNLVKRYRGRKLLVMKCRDLRDSFKLLPLLSWCRRLSMPLASPFENRVTYLHATCDELWCVEVKGSLFLMNPSTQTYRKLPNPSLSPWPTRYRYKFSYGLGYDSVDDDYKMVKVQKNGEAELYSLRSNSWREIQHRANPSGVDWTFSRVIIDCKTENAFHEYNLRMGVSLAGKLHWLTIPYLNPFASYLHQVKLISFDLSTEKYGGLGLPKYLNSVDHHRQIVMTVLKGMLCLSITNWGVGFELWMMEDYGVVESWTMKIRIYFRSHRCLGWYPELRPFYFDENGKILINVCLSEVKYVDKFQGKYWGRDGEGNHSKIFVYRVDEQTLVEMYCGSRPINDSFVYVESLVLLEMGEDFI